MSFENESFTWSIQVLSPLHIFGGEEIDPLSYVVLEREHAIGLFDSLRVAEAIAEPSHPDLLGLLRGHRSDQLIEVMKFFNKHLLPGKITQKVAASSGFIEELCQTLGIRSSGAAVNLQAEMIARLKAQMSGAKPARGGRVGGEFGGRSEARGDGKKRGEPLSRDPHGHSRDRRDFGRREEHHSEARRTSAFELGFARVLRGPNGPYIPGSSVKGAIRSAVIAAALSRLDAAGLLPPHVNHTTSIRAIEKFIFRGLSDDPFRFLSISDFELEEDAATEVRFALLPASRDGGKRRGRRGEERGGNRGRDGNHPGRVVGTGSVGDIYSPRASRLVEVVVPGSRFRGRITVGKVSRALLPGGGCANPRLQEIFDFEHSSLIAALNEFFMPIKDRELKRCESFKIKPKIRTSDGEALLRLGHFVGSEAKQLPMFRHSLESTPPITTCGDRFGKGDLSPFGWVSVEMV